MTRPASPAAGKPAARRPGLRRRFGDGVTAVLAIGAMKLVQRLPERLVWALAGVAGRVSYRVARTRRRRARQNLRRVVEWMAANGRGDESYRAAASDPRAFEAIVRSAFVNHAYYYVELARAPLCTAAWVRERLLIATPEAVDAALTERRAIIIIGLHFGAIEMPGFYAVSRLGSIVAPMETVANARVQRYIFSTRATIGVRIVTLQAAAGELLAALRRDEPVGLVADRELTGGGIEVELFGSMTKIPAGPALLAAETGAPMCMSTVRRVGRARYLGCLRPVPLAEGANRRERSRATAREEARLFEEFISDAPEQWLALFHPIWPDLERPEMRRDGDRA